MLRGKTVTTATHGNVKRQLPTMVPLHWGHTAEPGHKACPPQKEPANQFAPTEGCLLPQRYQNAISGK